MYENIKLPSEYVIVMYLDCFLFGKFYCNELIFSRFSYHYLEQILSLYANKFSASREISAFYGSRKFITAFTSARQLSKSFRTFLKNRH